MNLAPCYCGAAAVEIEGDLPLNSGRHMSIWSVWCKSCDIGTGWFRSREDARATWNRKGKGHENQGPK